MRTIRFNLSLDEAEVSRLQAAAEQKIMSFFRFVIVFQHNVLRIYDTMEAAELYELEFFLEGDLLVADQLNVLMEEANTVRLMDTYNRLTGAQHKKELFASYPLSFHYLHVGAILQQLLQRHILLENAPVEANPVTVERFFKPVYYPFHAIPKMVEDYDNKGRHLDAAILRIALLMNQLNYADARRILNSALKDYPEEDILLLFAYLMGTDEYGHWDPVLYKKIFHKSKDIRLIKYLQFYHYFIAKEGNADMDGIKFPDSPPSSPIPGDGIDLVYWWAKYDHNLIAVEELLVKLEYISYWGGFNYVILKSLLGCTHAGLGNLQEALEYKLLAAFEKWDLPMLHQEIGIISIKLKDYELACFHLSAALELFISEQKKTECYIMRSLANAEEGHWEEAREDLRMAKGEVTEDIEEIRQQVIRIIEAYKSHQAATLMGSLCVKSF